MNIFNLIKFIKIYFFHPESSEATVFVANLMNHCTINEGEGLLSETTKIYTINWKSLFAQTKTETVFLVTCLCINVMDRGISPISFMISSPRKRMRSTNAVYRVDIKKALWWRGSVCVYSTWTSPTCKWQHRILLGVY